MKVLLYNWVDYLDDKGRGGGVSQYLRNLLHGLDMRDDVETVFLSSGVSHDLRRRPPRWSRVLHGPKKDRHRRFEIVNSGCLAPSHHSFGHPEQLSHPETEEAFAEFVDVMGPFDIVHFHNLEGLPANVLRLHDRFPGTRFVLTLHNYYPFCPQVNLWHREAHHCADFAKGARCVGCLPFQASPRMVRMAYATHFTLHKGGVGPGSAFYDRGAGPAMRLGMDTFRKVASARRIAAIARDRPAADPGSEPPPAPAAERARAFADRRAAMVALINRHCDRVLCVSDRTREIARDHGIDSDRLRTCRIGSDHAAHFDQTAPRDTLPGPDGTVRMAYLGYMRRDKGFYFLLNALEALDPTLAARMHLVFAAAGRDPEALGAFARLRTRFASLEWHDGYHRAEMDGILRGVDFGIIPGLWEDNLPQVAIELHSRHIPLLSSDRGGAQELGRCPEMVFRSGDTADLHRRLAAILSGEVDLGRYWSGAMAPVTLDGHVDALLASYRALRQTDRRATL